MISFHCNCSGEVTLSIMGRDRACILPSGVQMDIDDWYPLEEVEKGYLRTCVDIVEMLATQKDTVYLDKDGGISEPDSYEWKIRILPGGRRSVSQSRPWDGLGSGELEALDRMLKAPFLLRVFEGKGDDLCEALENLASWANHTADRARTANGPNQVWLQGEVNDFANRVDKEEACAA